MIFIKNFKIWLNWSEVRFFLNLKEVTEVEKAFLNTEQMLSKLDWLSINTPKNLKFFTDSVFALQKCIFYKATIRWTIKTHFFSFVWV